MDELEERKWKQFMDRAIKSCDAKTIDLLETLPPKVASVMLIQMGKKLCQDDEWNRIAKQLKPKWWEVWKHARGHSQK